MCFRRVSPSGPVTGRVPRVRVPHGRQEAVWLSKRLRPSSLSIAWYTTLFYSRTQQQVSPKIAWTGSYEGTKSWRWHTLSRTLSYILPSPRAPYHYPSLPCYTLYGPPSPSLLHTARYLMTGIRPRTRERKSFSWPWPISLISGIRRGASRR